MKKFIILDGSGYLYRSYHALPPLHDKDGHNINTIFGFFRMLIKLYQEKPNYFVVVWDSPVKTLRHESYEQYKANRPKMPDEFRWQVSMVKNIVNELDINNLEVPTYEADDIIYSLTKKCTLDGCNIFIESMDKDLKQLLSDNIFLTNNSKGELITNKSFIMEYGFEPKYMLDYLSLIGDSSDNIPGVKGIGTKTAIDLIKKYLTIENIYENLDNLSGKVKENLLIGKPMAEKSKALVKLMDVPVLENIDFNNFSIEIDIGLYNEILVNKYQFNAIYKSLSDLKNKLQSGEQLSLF